jgi:hypothetical protein
MKALIPLLLVSTSALAVTTVQYVQRASAERKRADQAIAMSQKQEARIRELERAQVALDQQLMEVQRPAPVDVPKTPGPSVSREPQPIRRAGVPIGPVTALQPAPTAGMVVRHWPRSQHRSPAAQRFEQWQRKSALQRQYAGLATALGVSQATADKLIDTLADQQMRLMSPKPVFDPANPNAMQKAMLDVQQQREADIAAVIGQDKLPQWQEFERTMPERSRVSRVGEQMQQMGVPLTDDQRQQLTQIMIDQSRDNPRPSFQNGQSPEETMQASLKWEEESEKALLERAKGVLTKDQYERYRDYQAWQSEMRADSIRYFQARPAMPVAEGTPEAAFGTVPAQRGLVPLVGELPAPPK